MNQRFSPRTFDQPGEPSARGIGISGGAFRGRVAFNKKDVSRLSAEDDANTGEADGVLLVLENPAPDEIPLILSVDALLAARGGSTSHAAVCVHGIEDRSYTAVLGASELRVGADEARFIGADGKVEHTVHAGDILSIHGQSGEVFVGSRSILEIDKKAKRNNKPVA